MSKNICRKISIQTFVTIFRCYYSVVLGWCLYYFVYMIGHDLPETAAEGEKIFQDFAEVTKKKNHTKVNSINSSLSKMKF